MGFASARDVLIGPEGRRVGLSADGKNVRSLDAVSAGRRIGRLGVKIGLAMRCTRTPVGHPAGRTALARRRIATAHPHEVSTSIGKGQGNKIWSCTMVPIPHWGQRRSWAQKFG